VLRPRRRCLRARRLRQPSLIRRLRVALDLLERGVAADGRYLMHSASGLREPPTRRLPQAVERADARQSGGAAGFDKPRGESVGIKRLAALRMKEYKGSPALGDAGLLASAQAVEHYEIPATGL
jgi:hypothetical protein